MDPDGDGSFHRKEAISAVQDVDQYYGDDDDYDDLYNDVNVGNGFLHASQPPPPPPPQPPALPPKQHQPPPQQGLPPPPPMGHPEKVHIPGVASGPGPVMDRPNPSHLPPLQPPVAAAPPPPHHHQIQTGGDGFHRQGGANYGGGPIVVGNGGGGDGPGATTLFVGDLHWWTTDADLEAELVKYGHVKEVRFFDEKASGKSKDYCQVDFFDPGAAAACKEGMNGHLFNGRPCVVAFASPNGKNVRRKRPEAQRGASEEEIGMLSNRMSDEGLQLHAAEKRPEVQEGDSEEVMEMRSNQMSDEGLQLHAAEKRPEVQEGDSEEVTEMRSNRMSDEGLQLHAAEKRPEVQGGDSDVMDAETRSGILQIVMQTMQPGVQKEMLAKLLEYEEENQPHKQEDQLQKQKLLQNLMQSIQPSDQKEKLAKLLRYEEGNQPPKQGNQQQKQENQPRKQNKKHHRKSRMALRKVEMDKVKKSSLEKAPPREDKAAAYLVKWAKERESEPESEARSDWHAYQARLCRERWDKSFAASYGAYEKITSIPPMRFTDYGDASAGPREILQIFSVKVVGVKEGVEWPLYVYGKLAVRDTVDRNRNIIFDRERDNFQTVTEQNPYLILTGPSRAAVLSVRHSYIEAELKIKGSSSHSDDKDFSYLATGYIQTAPCQSFMVRRVLASRLSTLELTVGHMVNSVEATITMELHSGNWPCGYGGSITVSTASMSDMEIVLLTLADDELPLENDGKKVKLSRRVVGVEVDGKLNVAVKASPLPGDSSKVVLSDESFFTPKESGRSQLMLKVGACEMEVAVAWSLLLTYDH